MAAPARLLPRLRPFVASRAASVRMASTHTIKSQTPPTPIEPSKKQAHPIGPFYQAMLDDPMPTGQKTEAPPVTAAPKAAARKTQPQVETEPPVPSPPPATAAEKAAIIFGTTLAGPQSRAARMEAARRNKFTVVEGVSMPPKPEEPDNCCMSGCVNCVWERFREEMEEFQAAKAEVQRRLAAKKEGKQRGGDGDGAHAAVSMDDDGGGSDTNWVPEAAPKTGATKNLWDDSLYQDIPVGIREFMKTERKLKEGHEREGSLGG